MGAGSDSCDGPPMIDSLLLSHSLMMLAAAGAAACAVPEGRRRLIRRWQLLLPAALAAVATLLLVAYPSFSELRRPELWMFALGATVVGFVRGQFMSLQVDHAWRVVRLPGVPDGLWMAIVLALLAALEVVRAVDGGVADGFLPTLEFAMVMVAGYLVGRAIAGWARVRQMPNSELRGPMAAPRP